MESQPLWINQLTLICTVSNEIDFWHRHSKKLGKRIESTEQKAFLKRGFSKKGAFRKRGFVKIGPFLNIHSILIKRTLFRKALLRIDLCTNANRYTVKHPAPSILEKVANSRF